MKNFAVITDSGADLSQELIDKYNIYIMPFSVVLPDTDEILKEGVDITNQQYYDRVITASKHPSTSQPNPSDMLEIINQIPDSAEVILYITMGSSITGTFNTAHIARKMYEDEGGKADIRIYDSSQASMAIGLQALKASVLFQQGKTVDEVLTEIDNFRLKELKSTLTVESLKYLMKGGRVSKFRYAVGTVLSLTPCLEGTHDGKLEAFSATRSYKDAIRKVVDQAYEDIRSKDDLAVYLTAGRADKGIEIAKKYLQENYPDIRIMEVFELGAAIFTHTGPGTVVVLMFKYFEH